MPAPLLYDNPVVLNSKIHLNLRIRPSDEGLRFTARTNSVVLAGVEFPEACRHFPIVFAKAAGKQALPIALLGFRDRENLFVDAEGRWKGGYVPAYIRRYPFVLAKTEGSQQFAVCIDEAYPGFGADEGEALFNAKGEPSDHLKGVLVFLQDFQNQLERTERFLRTLVELDLLTEQSANLTLADGQRYSLPGLMIVDERKLQALPDEKILQLFRSGELAWIHSHLISIANFKDLPGKASQDLPGTAAEKTAALAKPVRKKGG